MYNIYIYTLLNIINIYIHYSIYQPRIHTRSGPEKKLNLRSQSHRLCGLLLHIFFQGLRCLHQKKSVVNPGNQKSE